MAANNVRIVVLKFQFHRGFPKWLFLILQSDRFKGAAISPEFTEVSVYMILMGYLLMSTDYSVSFPRTL